MFRTNHTNWTCNCGTVITGLSFNSKECKDFGGNLVRITLWAFAERQI